MKLKDKNRLELTVFVLSAMLVAALLGYLAWQAVGPHSAPELITELGPMVPRAEGYGIPVTVINRGERTAEGIAIEVWLEGPDGEVIEQSTFDLALLPGGSRRTGWVEFRSDPTVGKLVSRVSGYQEP